MNKKLDRKRGKKDGQKIMGKTNEEKERPKRGKNEEMDEGEKIQE